jgi:HK97 gp10 family phage protein
VAKGGKAQIRFRVTGLQPVLRALAALPNAVANKVLRVALEKVSKPVLEDAKAKASKSKDTGALRASLSRRAKTYRRTGTSIVVVGPRTKWEKSRKKGSEGIEKLAGWARGFGDKPDVPTKYAHLVEFGTAPHYQPKLRRQHPGTKAKPFMEPAWRQNKDRVNAALRAEILAGIEREAKKLAAKSGGKGKAK